MKTLICIVGIFLCIGLYAQSDTTTHTKSRITEVYDVVAVHKEIRDGRGGTRKYTSELKGEILNYDQSTGVLTFKSTDGKLYSLSSDEYKYFEYNKEFTTKNKVFTLKQRKESEFEFSAGVRVSFLNFNDHFTSDNYYQYSGGGNTDLPISIFAGVGKYFSRKHYVGINGEIAVMSYGSNYFAGGFNYRFQYDANKRNVAFYIPIGLNYLTSKYNQSFQLTDSVVAQLQASSDSYSSHQTVDYKISALSLSLGHGFSFILTNKHSISLELAFIKFFPLNTTFTDSLEQTPDIRMTGSGIRLGLAYNF